MRIAVFGAGGMLGKAVVAELRARRHQVSALTHGAWDIADAGEPSEWPGWDMAINCAGILRNRGHSALEMVRTNAVGPWALAQALPDRISHLIHISTDVVFSGVPDLRWSGRRYALTDRPDPVELYGRSKLAGEVDSPFVTNVRTSFVGFENGILEWLMENARAGVPSVPGWRNAMWTGSTVYAVARALADMVDDPPAGIVHLATERKWDKCSVLWLLRDTLDLDIHIESVPEPRIDTALEPTIELEPLEAAVRELPAKVEVSV